MTHPLALIVDDEPDIRELLEITLARMGIDTLAAPDLRQARTLLGTHRFDLCLADMRLPDGNGIDLVRQIGQEHPELPVAVITAHGNMESAIEALKAGAFDFVSKPVDLPVLRSLVDTALHLPAASEEFGNTSIPAQPASANLLLGESDEILNVRTLIGKLARSQAPVFISGESGTGKELAARLIHQQGARATQPFIAVNCGAIPGELMESEFFGHTKGSFTGAVAEKSGFFQAAHGGTLFLDEVADLPLEMQVKLLRAIQERRIRRIGSPNEDPVDVRIISATHKDMNKLLEAGNFRQDLYYRIHVIELKMPPLREHPGDIPLLANNLLDKITAGTAIKRPLIDAQAMKILREYSYPGNVRELENILERAVALCENGIIHQEDFGFTPSTSTRGEIIHSTLEGSESLDDHLTRIERELIINALEATNWNRTAAAEKLGISFRALRYKLDKLDINQE